MFEIEALVLIYALRKSLLPRAPRDDWGSETERVCQLLEQLEKECTNLVCYLKAPTNS